MKKIKEAVHAQNAYKMGYTGKNIRVAVLDTGIYMHRDIRENLVGFADFVNGRLSPYDDNGHGTHVAGIIAANGGLKGIAPKAKILALKVLETDGGGKTEDVKAALLWLLKKHRTYDVGLINFSVGFLSGTKERDQADIIELLERLWEEGVCVVTAAGNNGPTSGSIAVPGISRKIITVGACDDMPGNYSGRGPTGCCIVKPEILAPGTNVISLYNRDNRYIKKSGTSMAAPVVTGALALALEKTPYLYPWELKLRLLKSAAKLPEKTYIRGRLDVDSLLAIQ